MIMFECCTYSMDRTKVGKTDTNLRATTPAMKQLKSRSTFVQMESRTRTQFDLRSDRLTKPRHPLEVAATATRPSGEGYAETRSRFTTEGRREREHLAVEYELLKDRYLLPARVMTLVVCGAEDRC
jgi:hypothetical protein